MTSNGRENSSFKISKINKVDQPGTVSQHLLTFNVGRVFFSKFRETEEKLSVPAYSGAVYGDTLYKADQNIVAMSGIAIDFDNERKIDGEKWCLEHPVLPKDIENKFGKAPWFFHSTHSNQTDWPKWRMYMPFGRLVSRQEWPIVVNGILKQLGDFREGIDMSCFEPSRHFLFPSYSGANKNSAFAGYFNGQEVVHVC